MAVHTRQSMPVDLFDEWVLNPDNAGHDYEYELIQTYQNREKSAS